MYVSGRERERRQANVEYDPRSRFAWAFNNRNAFHLAVNANAVAIWIAFHSAKMFSLRSIFVRAKNNITPNSWNSRGSFHSFSVSSSSLFYVGVMLFIRFVCQSVLLLLLLLRFFSLKLSSIFCCFGLPHCKSFCIRCYVLFFLFVLFHYTSDDFCHRISLFFRAVCLVCVHWNTFTNWI